MISDIAVVVVEPEPDCVIVTAPLLHFLNSHDISYIIFINKMDFASAWARDILSALQGGSWCQNGPTLANWAILPHRSKFPTKCRVGIVGMWWKPICHNRKCMVELSTCGR
jgi:hypothetical protein